MLVLHITIALASLAAAGVVVVQPSQKVLHLSYGLISATFISGLALIFLGYNVLHLCVAGVMYSVVSVATVAVARKRLAPQV